MLEKDGLIKKKIKKKPFVELTSAEKKSKKAILKLVRKLPKGIVLDEERI